MQMSANLRIPPGGYKGLKIFQGLQPDALKELINALNRSPLSFDRDEYVKSVIEAVSKISQDDLDPLLRTIFSLHVTYTHSDKTIHSFLDDVVDTIKASDQYEENFSSTDWTKFRESFENIFALEPLICLSKAVDIVSEHACLYSDSRVLTDIRPVFGPSETTISALFITHSLKLEYFDATEERELYIALDDDDIKELIETLLRAQRKAQTIKATVVVEKLPFIEH